MSDDEYTQQLERIIGQMLKPLRGVPFQLVIKSLCGHEVQKVDLENPQDRALIDSIEKAVQRCGVDVRNHPIRRPRPNEVGNDIEPYVMSALSAEGFQSVRPASKSGGNKSTGYPDILLTDQHGRATYIECKTFSAETSGTTMRSFYLSPSDQFKVTRDAHHLVISFEMEREPIADSRDSFYRPAGYKIVDTHGLLCDVKFEFNADNARLYAAGRLLRTGRI